MKTIRLLILAFSICLFEACASRNDGNSDSQTSEPDTAVAPGVGAAPDDSKKVSDSIIQQADSAAQADTTTVKKP